MSTLCISLPYPPESPKSPINFERHHPFQPLQAHVLLPCHGHGARTVFPLGRRHLVPTDVHVGRGLEELRHLACRAQFGAAPGRVVPRSLHWKGRGRIRKAQKPRRETELYIYIYVCVCDYIYIYICDTSATGARGWS